MKFEKLNLDAFSKEKLTDNKLRSINGGLMITLVLSNGDPAPAGEGDHVTMDHETHYTDSSTTECDDHLF